ALRDLVKDYLGKKVSRRSFINRATVAGFSFAAARSSLDALEPMVRAEVAQTVSLRDAAMQTDSLRYSLRQGTGGELLAEQIRATGTRFIFICNSSGMGPLCDAVVDRRSCNSFRAFPRIKRSRWLMVTPKPPDRHRSPASAALAVQSPAPTCIT